MNFYQHHFSEKLRHLRKAAAPRASIRMLHVSDGFQVFLGEAALARKVTEVGTVDDKAEDILNDPSVLCLFVPLADMTRFLDEVTPYYSVALVDVMLANRVNAARYVMYAHFPRNNPKGQQTFEEYQQGIEDKLTREYFPKTTDMPVALKEIKVGKMQPFLDFPDKLAPVRIEIIPGDKSFDW